MNQHSRLVSLFWVRVLLALGTWAVAAMAVLVAAAEVSIGPVVWVLSSRHGVHAFDVLVAVVAVLAATVGSVLIHLYVPSHVLVRGDRPLPDRTGARKAPDRLPGAG